MPGRVTRSQPLSGSSKSACSKGKKRTFDAYAAAAKQLPEKAIPRHRLGEDINDEPRHKRRRNDDEDADDDEEQSKKSRTRQQKSIGDQDDVEYGSDSSGNNWTMGGLAEDDNDSDLDSDEAFGESDEEKFEGFTFRGSRSSGKTKRKSAASASRGGVDFDLNESESDEFDDGDSEDDEGLGLGDDAVDLAAMLDDDENMGGKDSTLKDLGEASASDDEESEGDDEEEDDSSDAQSEDDEMDDEVDEERAARMRDRLEALDASKERPEPPPTSLEAATIDDFLEGTEFANDKQMSSSSRKKSANLAPLSAPLPKRQQDKISREVATDKAKEQLNRWRDTVVQNRRAEFLSFPLQNSNDEAGTTGKDKFAPASEQKPQTELEASIQRIMEESGLVAQPGEAHETALGDEEQALLKSEELATKQMPVEEVLRRRAELRRARELLFREEIKAKRIAKIKSKSYRRVHRKERERLAEDGRQMREELGEDAISDDEKEKNDRRRAAARMDTKHKDSKWAKSLKASGRAVWDDEARNGVVEQARRNEELKRRIAGDDISRDGSDAESDDDDDDLDEANMLRGLRDEVDTDTKPVKGLAGMKFMQAAEERRRKANDEDVERIRRELAIADGDEAESGDEMVDTNGLGRAIFGPASKAANPARKAKETRLEFEAPEQSDDENDDALQSKVSEDVENRSKSAHKPSQPSTQTVKQASKAQKAFSKGSSVPDKSSRDGAESEWLRQKPKSLTSKSRSTDADELTLDLTAPAPRKTREATSTKSSAALDSQAPNTQGWTTMEGQDEVADSDDDVDHHVSKKEQSLMQRAFAGEDVSISFAAAKRAVETSEDEKEVSTHLPGWGAWTGVGLSKREKQHNQRQKHNPLFKNKLLGGVKRADRQDAGRDNVIISEKHDRKGKKYLATQLPHEFETKEQYERSRRVPVGPEWNTKEVLQRNTRPRVIVKRGVIGQAIERPLV